MIKTPMETQDLVPLAEQFQFLSRCVMLYTQEMELSDIDAAEVEKNWIQSISRALHRILQILSSLRETLHWSLLDAHAEQFGQLRLQFEECVPEMLYREPLLPDILEIESLLVRGERGFQCEAEWETDYLKKLFDQNYVPYHTANLSRQETIYDQDSEDLLAELPDDVERKTYMVTQRRNALFDDFFGRIYHDERREIALLVTAIIHHKEQSYERIHAFFDKYLAWEVAKNRLAAHPEPVIYNHIFKDNVDVDKVMRKLSELIADHTISAQRHFYLVYRVFLLKAWLAKESQRLFCDQMNEVFAQKLKCTTLDFKKINGYYKHSDYHLWNPSDRLAPVSCKDYQDIVGRLDQEFQDERYALPGRLINSRVTQKEH